MEWMFKNKESNFFLNTGIVGSHAAAQRQTPGVQHGDRRFRTGDSVRFLNRFHPRGESFKFSENEY